MATRNRGVRTSGFDPLVRFVKIKNWILVRLGRLKNIFQAGRKKWPRKNKLRPCYEKLRQSEIIPKGKFFIKNFFIFKYF